MTEHDTFGENTYGSVLEWLFPATVLVAIAAAVVTYVWLEVGGVL